MTEDTPIPKKLNLMDAAQEGGRTQLDILISDTDDLVMEGYDTGPAVEDFSRSILVGTICGGAG